MFHPLASRKLRSMDVESRQIRLMIGRGQTQRFLNPDLTEKSGLIEMPHRDLLDLQRSRKVPVREYQHCHHKRNQNHVIEAPEVSMPVGRGLECLVQTHRDDCLSCLIESRKKVNTVLTLKLYGGSRNRLQRDHSSCWDSSLMMYGTVAEKGPVAHFLSTEECWQSGLGPVPAWASSLIHRPLI